MHTPLEALRELAVAREAARLQFHLLSMGGRARWRDLEERLESMEYEIEQGGERTSEAVLARVRSLAQTVKEFVANHGPQISELSAPVSSIMTHAVETCSPSDHLNDVARRLWETNCGSLPVVRSDGSLVGMITDRDICMACYTQNGAPSELVVSCSMAREIFACAPDDPIERPLEIMRERQVRRVPVTAEDGRLLGIVALADLARWAESTPTRLAAAQESLLATLAAISEPPRLSSARLSVRASAAE